MKRSKQSVAELLKKTILSSIVVALLPLPLTNGQNPVPTKEYIRLGSRVIAIENTAVSVTVNTPTRTAIAYGETETFTATVSGTSNQAVTWSMNPPTGSGSIDPNTGIYTAPTTPQSTPISVNITATSQAEPSVSGTYGDFTINPVFLPTSANVPAAGVTDATVTVTQGGSWTPTPDSAWIHVVSPSGSGDGNGALSYSVDENCNGSARSGNININTSIGVQSLLISQATGSCITVSNNPASIGGSGGTLTFTVNVTGTLSSNWGWANPNNYSSSLISLQSCSCGTVSGTISFLIGPTQTSQTLTITIAGVAVTINQTVTASPSITVNPTSFSNVSGAGAILASTVTVNNPPLASAWTVTSNASWIQASCTCSVNSGSVSIVVAPNSDPTNPRTGTVTVAAGSAGNATITVTQSAGALAITPSFALITPGSTQTFQATVNGTAVSVNWSFTDNNNTDSISPTSGSSTTFTAGSGITMTTNETITATLGNASATAGVEISPATVASFGPTPPVTSVAAQEQICDVIYNGANCLSQNTLTVIVAPGQFSYGTGANIYYEFNPGTTILVTTNPGPNPSAVSSCQFTWQNQGYTWYLSLTNDAGTGYVGGGNGWQQMGYGTSLSNSQCTIDVQHASNYPAGGEVTSGNGGEALTLGVTFTPAFAGTKSIWMEMLSNGYWYYQGTYYSTNPDPHCTGSPCPVQLGPTNIPWSNIGTLTVTAPANITPTLGTPQSAALNTSFSSVLEVAVTDANGVAVPNAAVTFTAPSSGASAAFSGSTRTTVVTNSSGIATATATANGQGGAYTVTASVPAIASPVSFNLTNFGSPATVTATGGTPQSTAVGLAYGAPLQAVIKDAGGNPVQGASVVFTAPSSGPGGSFSGVTTVTAATDITGTATAPTFTANAQAGSFPVTASISGLASTAAFSLTNLAATSASVIASAGTPQSTTASAAFAIPLQATVLDAYGNPASGLDVTFSVLGTNASATFSGGITAVTASTNSSGVATAPTLTANSQLGTFTVAANVTGISTPANFTLTNISGVTAPVFNPGGGAYPVAPSVSISTPTGGASIRYTTDGSTPSETAGTLYTSPVSISSDTTLNAIAYASGLTDSSITSANYTVAVAAPTFSPGTGAYQSPQTVTISTATPGASIRYTTDGSTPTETYGTLYASPISVTSTETINAIAYKTSMADSNVATAAYAFGWYNPSWTDRRSITIAHGQVSGSSNLTNYPMLFSVTDPVFKTVANGGYVGKSDGTDILFTAGDGETKLNHELEYYNASTGQVIAWVQIPSLSPTADTAIYVYYGNPSASNQQNATAVWDSNYKGVWHLANGTTLSAADSTSNVNNGTITGATATAGEVDGAGNFSGSSQYINIGDGTSLQITGDLTIEAWINPKSFANNNGILGKTKTNIPASYDFYLNSTTGVPGLFRGNGTTYGYYVGQSAPSTNAWSLIAVTMAGTTATHYLNGSANGSGTISTTLADKGNSAYIASRTDFATMFKGQIDEVRISNIARSAAWLTTEYSNQSSPLTFYSLGSPTSGTGAVTPTGGSPQSAPLSTAFGTPLQATVTDDSGNPISGVTVTFSAPGSGASALFAGFTTANAVTNSSGVAVAPTLTSNSTAGVYTVTASVSSVVATSASFNLTNAGPPASITTNAGTPQTALIKTVFGTALQAIVKDAANTPVSGVTVTFTAPGSGATAAFSGSASATATTNSSGIATAPALTANSTSGNYTVTASVSGVATAANFSLTNTASVVLTSGTSWIAPVGLTSIKVECVAGGGGGGSVTSSNGGAGGGGGGGAYARRNAMAVTPGNSYTYSIGAGGASAHAGGTTTFTGDSGVQCIAGGGGAGGTGSGGNGAAGAGATTATGDVTYSGGGGAAGEYAAEAGGGGGGSGGSGSNGNTAAGGYKGAKAVTGGGPGGNGDTGTGGAGNSPSTGPGGGGGGALAGGSVAHSGGAGAAGQITITVN